MNGFGRKNPNKIHIFRNIFKKLFCSHPKKDMAQVEKFYKLFVLFTITSNENWKQYIKVKLTLLQKKL